MSGVGIDRRVIYEALVVGNSTMRDLFFGVDVAPIGQKPYKSRIELEALAGRRSDSSLLEPAHRIGLWMHPRGRVVGAPLIASHVGADTAADLVAIGADELTGSWMLVEVGTNTEVVVSSGERLVAASCPAGPAFEGGLVRSDWFQQEIDRVAMRDGLVGTDAYLAGWAWSGDEPAGGEPDAAAEAVAARIVAELCQGWGRSVPDVAAPGSCQAAG